MAGLVSSSCATIVNIYGNCFKDNEPTCLLLLQLVLGSPCLTTEHGVEMLIYLVLICSTEYDRRQLCCQHKCSGAVHSAKMDECYDTYTRTIACSYITPSIVITDHRNLSLNEQHFFLYQINNCIPPQLYGCSVMLCGTIQE